ncbi:nucleotidyltransferase family protein [Temperatibacter marinus]|uniref:Nucleotidyltransferase family protein n=1 Tax=Temperatibacter marinus TaxID=1456591 RepID=A0AA52H9Q1_9PROT|nr:nucleotidyltransferase family protein [Temperatibacter marinus]WND03426.1 nucleotidyltransferase family protein [Temperatibacter marinus]
MTQSLSIAALILAAGESLRMGHLNKLLLKQGDKTLVHQAIQPYLPLCTSVTVVLGCDAQRVGDAIKMLPVETIITPQYKKGHHQSARFGLQALRSNPQDAVLIGLADQYALTHEDIAEMASLYKQDNKIIIPRIANKRGNPVLLPKRFIEPILASREPIRTFLDRHPEEISWLESTSTAFLQDIDTPEEAKSAGYSAE